MSNREQCQQLLQHQAAIKQLVCLTRVFMVPLQMPANIHFYLPVPFNAFSE